MKSRLLIVGIDGLLGGALRREFQSRGYDVAGTQLQDAAEEDGSLNLDLARSPDRWPVIPECRAAVLCAAITSLDQCRRDPAGTRQVNVVNTLELAKLLAARGCFVVFISSNLVFDGSKPLRRPDEPTSPQTEYGRQKAEVESGFRKLGGSNGIVRLTKVVHPELKLFRGWIQALSQGNPVSAFSDFLCSPIALAATVRSIATVAEKELPGVWQLSGAADVSYADIAEEFARRLGQNPALVQRASGQTANLLEHLPRHTTLDASRSHRELGFEISNPMITITRTFFS